MIPVIRKMDKSGRLTVPREARESFKLSEGQEFQVFVDEDSKSITFQALSEKDDPKFDELVEKDNIFESLDELFSELLKTHTTQIGSSVPKYKIGQTVIVKPIDLEDVNNPQVLGVIDILKIEDSKGNIDYSYTLTDKNGDTSIPVEEHRLTDVKGLLKHKCPCYNCSTFKENVFNIINGGIR